MKVLHLSVRNVLRISELELPIKESGLIFVGGKNGHGKTSSLTALMAALCGKSGMDWPDVILKDGEKEGVVTVKLSGDEELQDTEGFTVELSFRRKARQGTVVDEIRVLDSTGEEAPEPRTLLQRLYNLRGFDPLEFGRAKPAAREKLLRELLGLDFTELDAERKEKYAERTIVNRDGKAKKAEWEAIEIPDGTPDEEMSVSDLFQRLNQARATNEATRRELTDRRENLAAVTDNRDRMLAEEQRLRERLAEIEKLKPDAEKDVQEHTRLLAETEAKPIIDTAELEDQIQTCDKVNAAVRDKQKKRKLAQELEVLRTKSRNLSNRIEAIDDEKQRRLEEADYPLPGMSIDESGVLLNGLPFEQASTAERILASAKVGMALNPKLRLMICQNGNDLDNDTMAALDEALKESDFQMIVEVVTRSPEDEARCAVVLHEGRAKELDSAPVGGTDAQ